jgi:flagellar biosynthetic protein FlhB
MIVARGSGILAERIRRIGFTSGVLVIRSPELARALFKTRILEGEIPDKLYPAVADVYRRFDLVGRRAY